MTVFPAELPAPRVPDPMSAPVLTWGVLGTGWIAERFISAVRSGTRQRIAAVGSRAPETATAFARRTGIQRAHGSYEALVADPGIDVVYVATPHTAHLECARLALAAGKHVLVEKPLTPSAVQAEEIAALAADRGLFCAEALWTLFLPRYDVVRQILESGVLGTIRFAVAEYSEYFTDDHRIFRADLAGGPLLDLGIYPVALLTWLLGAPSTVAATAQPHPSGVHGQLGALLSDADGNQALLHTSVYGDTPATLTVTGSTGVVLTLPHPFPQPGEVVLTAPDGRTRTWSEPATGHGSLYYEAAEVARCIAAGERETPLRPLADSVTTLRTADRIRAACGIGFPGEQVAAVRRASSRSDSGRMGDGRT